MRRAVSHAGRSCDVAYVVALNAVAMVGAAAAADVEVVRNPPSFAMHHLRHLPRHRHHRHPCS